MTRPANGYLPMEPHPPSPLQGGAPGNQRLGTLGDCAEQSCPSDLFIFHTVTWTLNSHSVKLLKVWALFVIAASVALINIAGDTDTKIFL